MVTSLADFAYPLVHSRRSPRANPQQCLDIVVVVLPEDHAVAKSLMNVSRVEKVGTANVDWNAWFIGVRLPAQYRKQYRARVSLDDH
jgi:hypothetical protein